MQPDPTQNPADASGAPAAQPTGASAARTLSASETAALAQADLAAFLGVPAAQIQISSSASRTWPDQGLGCSARKGVYEPAQIAGYEFIFSHGGATYRYHSDQHGRVVRCPDPGKPIGPIAR